MLRQLLKPLHHLRHPVSLPEEVGGALGVPLPNNLSFHALLERLCGPDCCPSRIHRLMPRDKAEAAFATAKRKECFRTRSIFSYYFDDSWLEFSLHFDTEGRLRRLYVLHREIPELKGVEVTLRTQLAINS